MSSKTEDIKKDGKQQKKEKSTKDESKKATTSNNNPNDSKKENKNEKKAEKKENKKENQKEKKDEEPISIVPSISSEARKQKKKFFCLTSYDEFSDQLKSQKLSGELGNDISKKTLKHSNQTLSIKLNIAADKSERFNSKKLISILEQKNLTINEEMEIYLLKLSSNKIGGISKICREFFQALKTFVKKVDFVNLREMKEKIDTILELISVILSPGEKDDFGKDIKILGAVENSFKFIRNLLHSIEKFRPKFSEKLRDFICKKLDEFISTKIEATREAVADNASEIIKENDVILVFGKSEMYRLAMEKAKVKIKKFKIIFVDIYGKDSVYKELEYFSNLGVEVIYTYINGVSALISKVTKVFILARCMFANGYLLGNNGASMISCLAYNYKKPVIAFCETYKFCEKSQMDSYLYNNIIIENNHLGGKNKEETVNFLNMKYDLTPANYINMIICELGYLPTTSVPVVLREFGKNIELEEKELNYELK